MNINNCEAIDGGNALSCAQRFVMHIPPDVQSCVADIYPGYCKACVISLLCHLMNNTGRILHQFVSRIFIWPSSCTMGKTTLLRQKCMALLKTKKSCRGVATTYIRQIWIGILYLEGRPCGGHSHQYPQVMLCAAPIGFLEVNEQMMQMHISIHFTLKIVVMKSTTHIGRATIQLRPSPQEQML